MKRFTLALVFFVVAISVTTISVGVSAQEILLEGPLAGAPAVRKLVQYRRLRFSIGPQFSYTLKNEYMHNFLVGGRIEGNLTDWFGIGAVGYYGINVPTKLTGYIGESEDTGEAPTSATKSSWPSYTGSAHFEEQVAELKAQILGHISFTPFRGKMSLFERLFVAIDGSIFVGAGVVFINERNECDSFKQGTEQRDDMRDMEGMDTWTDECGGVWEGSRDGEFIGYNGTTVEKSLTPRFSFTWGVNFMSYFNDFVALNLEFRMSPFQWNAGGTDESGQAASTWNVIEGEDEQPEWSTSKQYNDRQNRNERIAAVEGDYPDGKIDKDDQQWNLNLSIGIGVIFYFPTKPRIEN